MSNTAKILCALLAGCASEATVETATSVTTSEPLAKSKLLIEHNATDEDTGFQGFADGEPWQQLDVRDADGKLVLSVHPRAGLHALGLTELFFETNEPENAEVPIDEVLEFLPAGTYDFIAKLVDGGFARGQATLSHVIPAGPCITSPAPDAEVSAESDLAFRWDPVTESIDGDPVTITHYQLIVSKLDQLPGPGFGAETLSFHIPASTTTMRVPHEFLQPATDYEYEVLAIADNGNQTLSSGEFSTD